MDKDVLNENELVQVETEKMLGHADKATNNTDKESLDQQVMSMMTVSENADPYANGRARICKVCGKEGSWINVRNHIALKFIILLGSLFPVASVDEFSKQETL